MSVILDRIGFFHFARGYAEPLHTLDEALLAHGTPGNSLIVLPEAFNKGRPYHDDPRGQPSVSRSDALAGLSRIGALHNIALIVGLLDPPLSSAYWVEGSGCRLMRHKRNDDRTGNYRPCEATCDHANPIEAGGVAVATLICNDIELDVQSTAHRLDQTVTPRKVLCIPACMDSVWFGSGDLQYDYWKRKCVVVANSNPSGCGSFTSNVRGEREIFKGLENRIILKCWSELGVAEAPPK